MYIVLLFYVPYFLITLPHVTECVFVDDCEAEFSSKPVYIRYGDHCTDNTSPRTQPRRWMVNSSFSYLRRLRDTATLECTRRHWMTLMINVCARKCSHSLILKQILKPY